MTESRKWTLVAGLVAVAVFVAGWFLVVAPKRSDAAALKTQNSKAQAANDQLRAKLEELKALAPQLPKREAEFAAIRRQIPDNPALPDLVRQLTAAAKKSDADLTALAPAPPIALVATAPTTPGGAAASSEQLLQVPLTLTVKGSYTELEDYVSRLEKLRRVLLVTGFALTSETDTESGASDLSLSLTGRVFMVHAGTAATTAAAPVAAGSATPSPSSSTAPSTVGSAPTGQTTN
jgi:Tfp pilus assembly protein PilO